MQNFGRIYTEWTKAPNFAHSFLRVYLTTLGPVPKKIVFPSLVRIQILKWSKSELPGYQARVEKLFLGVDQCRLMIKTT